MRCPSNVRLQLESLPLEVYFFIILCSTWLINAAWLSIPIANGSPRVYLTFQLVFLSFGFLLTLVFWNYVLTLGGFPQYSPLECVLHGLILLAATLGAYFLGVRHIAYLVLLVGNIPALTLLFTFVPSYIYHMKKHIEVEVPHAVSNDPAVEVDASTLNPTLSNPGEQETQTKVQVPSDQHQTEFDEAHIEMEGAPSKETDLQIVQKERDPDGDEAVVENYWPVAFYFLCIAQFFFLTNLVQQLTLNKRLPRLGSVMIFSISRMVWEKTFDYTMQKFPGHDSHSYNQAWILYGLFFCGFAFELSSRSLFLEENSMLAVVTFGLFNAVVNFLLGPLRDTAWYIAWSKRYEERHTGNAGWLHGKVIAMLTAEDRDGWFFTVLVLQTTCSVVASLVYWGFVSTLRIYPQLGSVFLFEASIAYSSREQYTAFTIRMFLLAIILIIGLCLNAGILYKYSNLNLTTCKDRILHGDGLFILFPVATLHITQLVINSRTFGFYDPDFFETSG